MTTWRELVARSAAQLEEHEARILVGEVAHRSLSDLVLSLDDDVPDEASATLNELVARRVAGEPLQHVLGHWSFRDLELVVDRRALIPRPETEVVVGCALDELRRRHVRAPLALDIGTGSGAIACALAHEDQDVRVIGVDVDLDALTLAQLNRDRLLENEASRVVLIGADLYSALSNAVHFDLIVSNPPYVSMDEWAALDPVVRDYDPRRALVSGTTGLEAIERVIAEGRRHLNDGGSVVIEIAPHQAHAVAALAEGSGAHDVVVQCDLAGRERALIARYGHVDHY